MLKEMVLSEKLFYFSCIKIEEILLYGDLIQVSSSCTGMT